MKMSLGEVVLIGGILVALLLSGCAGAVVSACPPSNPHDEKVSEELETIPFEGYEDLWDWIAEIEVLNEQLDECQ